MSKRKLPFGYEMKQGQIVVMCDEAELVQTMFGWYLADKSLACITTQLREQNVAYDIGRMWNKNIVARILEDERYLGSHGYPRLITQEIFDAVAIRRKEIAKDAEIPESRKALRKVCKRISVTDELTQQVLELLNLLISNPHIIQPPKDQKPKATMVETLQRQFDEAMNQPEVDDTALQKMVLELGAARCAEISSAAYETHRLYAILDGASPMTELRGDFLQAIAVSVQKHKGVLSMELRNGQIISGRDFCE